MDSINWKLDRLFRYLKDLVATLQEFTELGIQFINLKDNIDPTTSSGRLMMHMIGAFAEFEGSLIRERVKAGVSNARAKGRVLGRPKTCPRNEVIRLRSQGLSVRKIASELNISKTSAQRLSQVSA